MGFSGRSSEGLKITSFLEAPMALGMILYRLQLLDLETASMDTFWKAFFWGSSHSRAKQLRSISTSSWRFQLGDGYSVSCSVSLEGKEHTH